MWFPKWCSKWCPKWCPKWGHLPNVMPKVMYSPNVMPKVMPEVMLLPKAMPEVMFIPKWCFSNNYYLDTIYNQNTTVFTLTKKFFIWVHLLGIGLRHTKPPEGGTMENVWRPHILWSKIPTSWWSWQQVTGNLPKVYSAPLSPGVAQPTWETGNSVPQLGVYVHKLDNNLPSYR